MTDDRAVVRYIDLRVRTTMCAATAAATLLAALAQPWLQFGPDEVMVWEPFNWDADTSQPAGWVLVAAITLAVVAVAVPRWATAALVCLAAVAAAIVEVRYAVQIRGHGDLSAGWGVAVAGTAALAVTFVPRAWRGWPEP